MSSSYQTQEWRTWNGREWVDRDCGVQREITQADKDHWERERLKAMQNMPLEPWKGF